MAQISYSLDRYSRQLPLPGLGVAGQEKLGRAKVLVAGAGGLGATALLYLAGAGVGSITVVDDGCVEENNLHRQVIYSMDDIGAPKAKTAARRMNALNPQVRATGICEKITTSSAQKLFAGQDLVLDCTDNFPARNAINEACFALGLKYVYAAAYRYEGQLAVFNPRHGVCYRCLYPETAGERHGACTEFGIAGPAAGILGALQALEALKILAGMDGTMEGKLCLLDCFTLESSIIQIKKKPDCTICSGGNY